MNALVTLGIAAQIVPVLFIIYVGVKSMLDNRAEKRR